MLPPLRAAADRLLFDFGHVKYIAANLPKKGMDRVVPGSEWTVRQVIGHLSADLLGQSEAVARFLAGQPPVPPGWDLQAANERAAATDAGASLRSLVARLDTAWLATNDVYERIDDTTAASDFRGSPLVDVLSRWTRHTTAHGMDLIEALPELRYDPMLLNWILFADFDWNPEAAAKQRKLWDDVRALPDEDEPETEPDEEEDAL
ncbi:MAG: maleylpyruvate isomerase N-terminal domain-containing protein [Chloroflexi bacterium]|nr:maleylpyruvate isomerase N-terminal domain-containing protein [Chloroflexota bacterium]